MKMHKWTKICWLSVGLLAPWMTSCGRDTGYLYEQKPVQVRDVAGERSEFSLTKSAYKSMNWFMQCPTDVVTVPASNAREIFLDGMGPHKLYRERLVGTPVTFSGRLCPARAYSRDVVIAIDGSGSMKWTDPRVGDSCARLNALNAILDSLPAGTKISAFGFSNEFDFSTDRFFDTKAELFAALIQSYNTLNGIQNAKIADAVCWLGGGSTDLNFAMQAAKDLFAAGRARGTKKELYLVTDGERRAISNAVALRLADEMKTVGVAVDGESIKATIASALIADPDYPGSDQILAQISSTGVAGQAMWLPVSQATTLTGYAAEFAVNEWATAKLDYAVSGSGSWKTVDVKASMSGLTFALAPVVFDIDGRQPGYDLKFGYSDSHGNKVDLAGKIEWVD